MSRKLIAAVAGLAFVIAWIAGAMVVADLVLRMNFIVQFGYFAIAGVAWVLPVRWLMLWSAHLR